MAAAQENTPGTGFAVIHGNRLEMLRELLVHWLGQHPLGVLENETILVQSNGIAQWLRLALANPPDDPLQPGCGIAAALDIQLPSAFLWRAYRAVLGAEQVPRVSPYDKPLLTWRLMRLLPELLAQPDFAQLRRFLEKDITERKQYQLAERLADLLDQYQVYRADWLQAWAAGEACLIDARGEKRPLPADQRWQSALWRAVREDLDDAERDLSRADLHHRFLQACESLAERPRALPRRIVVFGISALPSQSIEALAALARHSQVLLCIHNPCRHYWADIVDGKDLLRAESRRQRLKPGMPAEVDESDLHLHAQPLLASWGKQGRDYIRLLDQFDDTERYRDWFDRIDLFDDPEEPVEALPLLRQLQQDILDLTPLPDSPRPLAEGDRSLVFQVAHSRQREVEILQDQLLRRFQEDPSLRPRDVIIMVPDVDQYAPHVQAVFGRLEPEDPRYLPFTLADLQSRGRQPLLIALELLLQVNRERFGVSQLFDLLEVPAIQRRFGLAETDLPALHRWITGSGIRWGLDSHQRSALDLPEGLEQNTWLFGLRRMLLGYAMGGDVDFRGIQAYGEVGGLEAELVGPLGLLLDELLALREQLLAPLPPARWQATLSALLNDFLEPADDRDLVLLDHLQNSLEEWRDACDRAGLETPLPLEVVSEHWLSGMDERNLGQRFLGGAVNFSTLMPMRAIPFRVVCLLGMNDGDYPRVQPPMDFDLMAGDYRPGDRSRREDDRYLFLEALLSARDALHISWVGRSVRDNTEQPPSVLVAQLRDHIRQGWRDSAGEDPLAPLTTEHPLQAFSTAYFHPDGDPELFTYAREWREVHGPTPAAGGNSLPPAAPDRLGLRQLRNFLRHPVRTFFNERLNVWFESPAEAPGEHEPFGYDSLEQFQLGRELIDAALAAQEPEDGLKDQLNRWRRAGVVPPGPFGERALAQKIVSPAEATLRHLHTLFREWLPVDAPLEINLPLNGDVVLEDWIGGLYRRESDSALILPSPQAVSSEEGPRWHRLVAPWVDHLAVSAMGENITTFLVGPETTVFLAPVPPAQARDHLAALHEAYLEALQHPPPLACKTAFRLLTSEKQDPEAEAASTFEGGYNHSGEREQDSYLQRAWPDFTALVAAGLEDWGERLYRPLIRHARVAGEEEDA